MIALGVCPWLGDHKVRPVARVRACVLVVEIACMLLRAVVTQQASLLHTRDPGRGKKHKGVHLRYQVYRTWTVAHHPRQPLHFSLHF